MLNIISPKTMYQWKYTKKNKLMFSDEIFRITKAGGSFFYNHKTRWERGTMIHPMEWFLKTKWTIRQEIIWDRMIAANIRGWRFWQVDERIYWLYKPIENNKIGKELKSKHALLLQFGVFHLREKKMHTLLHFLVLPARIISLSGRQKRSDFRSVSLIVEQLVWPQNYSDQIILV